MEAAVRASCMSYMEAAVIIDGSRASYMEAAVIIDGSRALYMEDAVLGAPVNMG
jgi:hypothetical protein